MLKLYCLILLLLGFQSFGQNILNDSKSSKGKILKQLKADGEIMISLKNFGCNKVIPGYRICNADSRIESLNKSLTNREIDLLSTSENPTIKFVAFILFMKRNNNKRVAVEKLKHILNTERFILMSDACEPKIANSLSSFQYLCFHTLNGLTRFFKPNFKFTKEEIETFNFRIERQMDNYKKIVCP